MRLYFKYFSIHFKSELQYKLSFILSFISNLLVFFGYYFSIICLFDKFSNIKGFTMYEVLLTFGIVQFGFTFCEMFFRGVDHFDDMMIRGDFDRLLLRPRGLLFQVFCDEISLVRFARLIQAIIILLISIFNLNIIWNFEKIVTLIFMILSSIIIYLSILIITAAYCFITLKGLEFRNVLLYGSRELAQYPIGIFKKGFLMIFTYIIPFGFVNYYPLLFLLDRTSNKLLIISPLITIAYLIISILIFYKGVKKYSSTGS